MGISGKETALLAANTVFSTALNGILSQKVPGLYSQFTTTLQGTGTSADLIFIDGEPQVREWFGDKQFNDLRAYRLHVALRKWEKSIRVDLNDVIGDKTGAVGQRIADTVASFPYVYDQIMFSHLLSNPSCFDGTTLMSDSHTNTGGTSDNLSTAALSYSVFKTAWAALKNMKSEAGEPIDVTPSHLLVGPAQEILARDLTGSEKPLGLSTAGVWDATSNVVAAGTVKNYVGGVVQVIVSPRITGNEWFLMDCTKGAAKPLCLVEFAGIEGTSMDQPTDPGVFYRDECEYSLVAKASPAAGDWHLIYGSVTT